MAENLMTCTETVQTDGRTVTIDNVLLYVAEVNNEMAEEFGVDLITTAAAGVDAAGAAVIVKKLGLTGRAYVKQVNGKSYVIIKGYPGHRAVLNGTRYLKSNPKVAKMVLTGKDLAKGAAKMTGLAIVAFAGLRIVEHVLSDNDPSLARLLGTITTDVAKFAMAAGAGYLAGIAVGALTTLAAGPIIAAIAVGIGASIVLDRVDRRYGLTDSLVRALEDTAESYDNAFRRLSRYMHAWEEHLVQKAINQSRFR